jgi:hypothetical protein
VAPSDIITSRFKAQVNSLMTHVETTTKEDPWPSSMLKENTLKKDCVEISKPTVMVLE